MGETSDLTDERHVLGEGVHEVAYSSIGGRYADLQGAYLQMFACKGLIFTCLHARGLSVHVCMQGGYQYIYDMPYHICDRL